MEANGSDATESTQPWFPGPSSPYSLPQALLIGLILFIVCVVTIVGNILVCVAVCLVKKLRRPCNYLLVSLAVSDLCVAILVMPMAVLNEILGTWVLGPIMCDIWVSFDVLSCAASILNLCMISVDRYYAITKPLEYGVKRTPKRMIFWVSMVWLGAACISLPPLLLLGNSLNANPRNPEEMVCVVSQNFGYQLYATLASFYIPLSVMMFVYYKIFKAARKIVSEERKAQTHLETTHCYLEINKNGSGPESRLAVSCASSPATRGHHRTSTTSTNTTVSLRIVSYDAHFDIGAWIKRATYFQKLLDKFEYIVNSTCLSEAIKEYVLDLTFDAQILLAIDTVTALKLEPSVRQLIKLVNKGMTVYVPFINKLRTVNVKLHELKIEADARRCSGSVVGGTRVSSESQCPMLTGRLKRRPQVQPPGPNRKLRFQLAKERKASTTLGIIMSAFTICWLPFFVLALVRPFLKNQDDIPRSLSSLFLWLGYANSLLNPVIYATLNRDFRRPFQQILYFRCGSLNHMMREEFYQSQYGDPNPPMVNEDEPTCDLMPVCELKTSGHESFL